MLRQDPIRACADEKGRNRMAAQRTDPSDDVPEADFLEQQIPIDPTPAADAGLAAETPESLDDAADHVDRLEQREVVLDDDDDAYPHHEAGQPGS